MSVCMDVTVAPRARRGARNYQSGLAAEGIAERIYAGAGARVIARRWRGKGGEIDLVLEDEGVIVFAEVKKARSHDAAKESLRPAQVRRIRAAGSEFMGTLPTGQLTRVRFDLVTVDGAGHCRVMEGLLSHF